MRSDRRNKRIYKEIVVSKVVLDFSMSLDGFITGLNRDLERLHAWMFREHAPDRTAEILAEFFKTTGASVMGRGLYGKK